MTSEKEVSFIKETPFASLISSDDNRVAHITKIPLLLKQNSKNPILEGHIAKANPHSNFLLKNPNVTATFDGPHGYISPTWYSNPAKNVPTWNYTTVSITGVAKIITSPDWILESVMELTDRFEESDAWKESVDQTYVKNLSSGIVGIQISIDSMKSIFKLSQNKSQTELDLLIDNLQKQNTLLAEEMEKQQKEAKWKI